MADYDSRPTVDDLDRLEQFLLSQGCLLSEKPEYDNDGGDDYFIVKEVRVKRPALDERQFTVYLTDDRALGITFENTKRIGRRMNAIGSSVHGGGGFEPTYMHREGLAVLVNLAAMGRISIFSRALLGMVGFSRVAIARADWSDLEAQGVKTGWVRPLERQPPLTKMLTYRRWLAQPWSLDAQQSKPVFTTHT